MVMHLHSKFPTMVILESLKVQNGYTLFLARSRTRAISTTYDLNFPSLVSFRKCYTREWGRAFFPLGLNSFLRWFHTRSAPSLLYKGSNVERGKRITHTSTSVLSPISTTKQSCLQPPWAPTPALTSGAMVWVGRSWL
jgi:hypothetical protein